MDFRLNEQQRAWQMIARKFAEEEIRKVSVKRDAIDDPRATFDWEIIRKGSQLGLRTLGVPYSDEDIAGARDAVKGKTEMDAMVAYLQVLGTALTNKR